MMVSAAALLSVPVQAQTMSSWERSSSSSEVVSVRECHPPADAKEAQVLAFDRTSLEAKLAVNMGKGEFKVVTIKLWDRSEDTRPIIPVIEAARITQGKLHLGPWEHIFYYEFDGRRRKRVLVKILGE